MSLVVTTATETNGHRDGKSRPRREKLRQSAGEGLMDLKRGIGTLGVDRPYTTKMWEVVVGRMLTIQEVKGW